MSTILSESDIVKDSRFSTESGAKKSLEAYHKAKLSLKDITKRVSAWRGDLIGWAEVYGNFNSTSAQIIDTSFQPSGTGWGKILEDIAKGNPELAALIKTAKDESKSKRAATKRIDSK